MMDLLFMTILYTTIRFYYKIQTCMYFYYQSNYLSKHKTTHTSLTGAEPKSITFLSGRCVVVDLTKPAKKNLYIYNGTQKKSDQTKMSITQRSTL
jgi:hypothetical protein